MAILHLPQDSPGSKKKKTRGDKGNLKKAEKRSASRRLKKTPGAEEGIHPSPAPVPFSYLPKRAALARVARPEAPVAR
jgi:hypothetical protein